MVHFLVHPDRVSFALRSQSVVMKNDAQMCSFRDQANPQALKRVRHLGKLQHDDERTSAEPGEDVTYI